MSIQQKISLLFTAISGSILFLVMGLVYFSAYQNRLQEFYNILEKEATTKANLLLETKLDAETLQTIYRNNREILYEVEVAIYDQQQLLVYHDAVDIDFVKETPEMLVQISHKQHVRFTQVVWQVIGMSMRHGGETYLITAAAYDGYGISKLENLRNTLLMAFLLGMLLIFFLGKYFARKTFEPLAKMTQEADNISATNLHLRLDEGKGKDELERMAITFNQMLERLEQSFDAQRQLVSYVAHELRTPLAASIAELEMSLEKESDKELYRNTLKNVLHDSRKLAKLATALLDVAKASMDRSEILFKPCAVDEILLDCSEQLMLAKPGYRVFLKIEEVEKENTFEIQGNPYLLSVAFTNLMENACKFSGNNTCWIDLRREAHIISLSFRDEGEGISPEELDKIFLPFFRGSSQNFQEGSGIGLALVEKIAKLHGARLEVKSVLGKGSSFILQFGA